MKQDRIPRLRGKLSKINEEVQGFEAKIEDAEVGAALAQQEFEETEHLRSTCENLHRLGLEIEASRKEVEREAMKLGLSGDVTETMESINREMSRLNSELDSVTQQLEDAKKRRESLQTRLNNSARIVSECEKNLMEWRLSSEQLTTATRQEQDLQSEISRLQRELDDIQKEMTPIQSKLDAAKQSQLAVEKEFQGELQRKQQEVDKLMRDVDVIDLCAGTIKKLVSWYFSSLTLLGMSKAVNANVCRPSPNQLMMDKRSRNRYSRGKSLCLATLLTACSSSTYKEQIESTQYELSNQATLEREIQDNIAFRNQLKQVHL